MIVIGQGVGVKACRVKWMISLAVPVLLLLNSVAALSGDILQVSSGIREPLSNLQQTGFNDLVTKEVFRRAGYEINILRMPAARALHDLDNGVTDADLVRIKKIGAVFQNIRVVPEKIIDFDFVAISKNLEFKPDGWDSLKPYEVGIVSGWRILEVNVKSNISVTRVEDTRQLIKILNNDRVDLVVSERWQARQAIKSLDINSLTIHEPPIKSNELFIVVHKRHEKLIPKLTSIIKSMKQDGSFERIYKQTLGKFEE